MNDIDHEMDLYLPPDPDRCWSGSVEPTQCNYWLVIVLAVMLLAVFFAGICWGMS